MRREKYMSGWRARAVSRERSLLNIILDMALARILSHWIPSHIRIGIERVWSISVPVSIKYDREYGKWVQDVCPLRRIISFHDPEYSRILFVFADIG
jgi:hypothetical protein